MNKNSKTDNFLNLPTKFGIKRYDWLIIGILLFGLLYRVLITWGGNFIFHIDSARDMLDVREMVVLNRPRLIGPTTGIDGFFTGPGWYYLLAIPFIISGGDPYAEVLLMNFFWLVGGIFLLKMMEKHGILAVVVAGSLWVASNYMVLASIYSYNPNPVTFLSPMLIFILAKYLEKGNLKTGLILGFLGAFFWNLEMAFTIFLPFIIVLGIILTKRFKYFLQKHFWLGVVLAFFSGVIPQILFELRHNFFMSRNLISYLTEQKSHKSTFVFFERVQNSMNTLIEGFNGTLLNQQIIIYLGILLIIFLFLFLIKKRQQIDIQILAAILVAIVPFIGFSIFPIVIRLWHVGASLAAIIFLIAVAIGKMERIKPKGNLIALGVSIVIIVFCIINLDLSKRLDINRPSADPSWFKNEITAIDYAYQQAKGKNFKAYVYSPGIIDLPYQYNFWWYGQQKYGYLPKDYAYLPNQPPYINQKERYSNGKTPPDSGLIVLIKEPGNPKLEDLWKNNFTSFKLLKSENTGPLRVEVRDETK